MVKKMLHPAVAATVIVLLYMSIPVLAVFVSTYLTTYAYMIMCVSLFAFIMLSGGLRRLSKMLYFMFPIGIYIVCTIFTENGSLLIAGYNGLLMLLTIAIGYYFAYYRDDVIPTLSRIIILALIITSLTTMIGVIRFPEAARTLATIASSDDPEGLKYAWYNIGGYEFVYTCVLLYPILILAYKKRRLGRAAFLALFLLLLALIIFAEYTIALLLFMVSSLLFFIGKRTTSSQLLLVGILAAVIMFMFQPAFQRFFLWLADVFESKVFAERLTALAGGVTGVEGSESNRLEFYNMSLEEFAKRPVFGNLFNRKLVGGGHSFILDCLANYGIFGGITLVMIYRNVYKFFFAPFKYEEGYGFILWTFVQAIILSVVNTGMWLNVTALFVPAFLSFIYNTYDEDDYEDILDS